jgi:hypothetical protein
MFVLCVVSKHKRQNAGQSRQTNTDEEQSIREYKKKKKSRAVKHSFQFNTQGQSQASVLHNLRY